MATFAVWAPRKKSMEVLVEGKKISMRPSGGGWWTAEDPQCGPGCDYLFSIEGGQARPDPRSAYQPQGVNGPSRLVDHQAFRWNDDLFQARPLSSALIYELHVGTFTREGTFQAAIDKLEHLAQLGVTHVELMPIAEFAGSRGWGYDGVHLFAPHHAYGGPTGLKHFVNACHGKGIGVLLDVVYNHLGPSGNYLPEFGPYFTDRHKTPWGSAINFDGAYSDDVRQFFLDNARMWLRDYHLDGLRLDAIHAILDTSAYPFLEQLTTEVKQLEAHLGRHLAMIAESDLNDPRVIHSHDRDGWGFHAQWNDDFHHALHTAMTSESNGYYLDFHGMEDLASTYRRAYLFRGHYSPYRLRSHGRRVSELEASSFIVYSQNHDQVGNRAVGERLNHLLNMDQAKVAAALTLLSPFIPMLFQGEEWGSSSPFQYFVDFSSEPDLAGAVAQGRRSEFPEFQNGDDALPDPQDERTFFSSKLNWEEVELPEHREMLDWYHRLIQLRRRLPVLADGRLERVETTFDEEHRWLCVKREGTYLVANLGQHRCTVPLAGSAGAELVLTSTSGARFFDSVLQLPGHSVALVVQANACDRAVQTNATRSEQVVTTST